MKGLVATLVLTCPIYAPADGWTTDVSGGYEGSRFLKVTVLDTAPH